LPNTAILLPPTSDADERQEQEIESLVNLMQEMKRVQEINKNTPGISDE